MPQPKNKFINWVEINSKALKNNVGLIKKIAGEKVGVIAVVKSNAYGHGLVPVAQILDQEKIAFLVVDSLFEATALRHAGIKSEILVHLPQHLKRRVVGG